MSDGKCKVVKLVDDELDSAAFTEDALALEFTRQHGGRLRYVALWSRWLIWGGCCWTFDDTIHVFDLAREVCRDAATKANTGQKTLAKANTVAGVERLAKADRVHAATVDQWDHDPWTLTTRGADGC